MSVPTSTGPRRAAVKALLTGQEQDGGFGGEPYRKWTGTHWRLVVLAELTAPADFALDWVSGDLGAHCRGVDGLPWAHASIHSNALGACKLLGLCRRPTHAASGGGHPLRAWPDGGWNCSIKARGHRSSFHDTHRYGAARHRTARSAVNISQGNVEPWNNDRGHIGGGL